MTTVDPSLQVEQVILLDPAGRPRGAAAKGSAHHRDTPLHLGFSCYVFDAHGRVLVTRRAPTKLTWPGIWSNACCGHPQPGETLRVAVTRRLREELGVAPLQLALALPDFVYRAVMDTGVVEHELCPVVVATIDGSLDLNLDEVDGAAWMGWEQLCARARHLPQSLSPWSVAQIAELARLPGTPLDWVGGCSSRGLDEPVACSPPVGGAGDRSLVDPRLEGLSTVEEVLTRFVADRASDLAGIDPTLTAVAGEIAALLAAGGKRLRPAFVHWGHRATGADTVPAVHAVAAAVEMLHTFALIHDDVMDQALSRRGRPSARRGLSRRQDAEGRDGDTGRFGDNAAILAGDLAFVWADELLETAALDPATMERVRRVFTRLRVEVLAGQYLDLRLDGDLDADPHAARRVALLKSGRYTVTRPLELGLAIGHGDAGTARALANYGDAVGLAFQLRDDVLGLFGDPAETGKSTIDDLRAGKRTLLVLRTLALATSSQRAILRRSLGNRELDDEDADVCREIVRASGALASIEALVRHQHAVALDALVSIRAPARQALQTLAEIALHRDR